MILSILTLSITLKNAAQCRVSFTRRVEIKPIMLAGIILNVVRLNVVMTSVVAAK